MLHKQSFFLYIGIAVILAVTVVTVSILGYLAPRSDWVKAVNNEDAVIVNKYRRGRTSTHPVEN